MCGPDSENSSPHLVSQAGYKPECKRERWVFLPRVHNAKIGDKVRSCEIREVLNVEPLL